MSDFSKTPPLEDSSIVGAMLLSTSGRMLSKGGH